MAVTRRRSRRAGRGRRRTTRRCRRAASGPGPTSPAPAFASRAGLPTTTRSRPTSRPGRRAGSDPRGAAIPRAPGAPGRRPERGAPAIATPLRRRVDTATRRARPRGRLVRQPQAIETRPLATALQVDLPRNPAVDPDGVDPGGLRQAQTGTRSRGIDPEPRPVSHRPVEAHDGAHQQAGHQQRGHRHRFRGHCPEPEGVPRAGRRLDVRRHGAGPARPGRCRPRGLGPGRVDVRARPPRGAAIRSTRRRAPLGLGKRNPGDRDLARLRVPERRLDRPARRTPASSGWQSAVRTGCGIATIRPRCVSSS